MKYSTVLTSIVLTTTTTVYSQLVLPLSQDAPRKPAALPSFQPLDHYQILLMDPAGPGPAMPPSENAPKTEQPAGSGGGSVMLSDVMGRDRSINLFAGFVRDVESASNRLDTSSQNTTVLAPLNSAVDKLPRKPWEDPKDYDELGANAYEGGDGRDRAQRNLRRFVEAHLVPVSPWSAGDKVKPVGGDQEIWWEEKDGHKVIQPGNIEVTGVASTVANGEVWILKSVRNYS